MRRSLGNQSLCEAKLTEARTDVQVNIEALLGQAYGWFYVRIKALQDVQKLKLKHKRKVTNKINLISKLVNSKYWTTTNLLKLLRKRFGPRHPVQTKFKEHHFLVNTDILLDEQKEAMLVLM